MIGYCPLASGSQGNSIFVRSSDTKVLIDAGISYRQLVLRLDEIGQSLEEIDAILITHEHTDHIRGLEMIAKKHKIPILANRDTAGAIVESMESPPTCKIFSTGEPFAFGDMEIHPFSVQHDTLDPVAFTITIEKIKCGFCTDIGYVTSHVVQQLQGCHYLYVEANHDPSMVHACPRHMRYKQRVLSRQGHLSNEQCAALIKEIYHEDLRHIYLAHLSSECNAEKKALHTIEAQLAALQSKARVEIAHRHKVSNFIKIKNL